MDGMTQFADHMMQHNPFGIKDVKGKVLYFKTYRDCYLYVMKEMRTYCKRGFVDLAVLVHHLTGFDDATCLEVARMGVKLNPVLRNEPLLIDWEHPDERLLKGIIKTLHLITETEYSWSMFDAAWIDFKTEKWSYDEET